jgi:ribonucleotide reductase beta subunit family protein with ferritin-like domain
MEGYFPEQEDIERDDEKRLAHQPVQYQHMYKFYKELEASFWTDEDIDKDCEKDPFDRDRASPGERRLFDYVQGFFAVSDFVVGDVIGSKLINRIKNTDVRLVYSFISMMENIHMITYSKVVEKAIKNTKERNDVLLSASKIPSIKRKVSWIRKWVGMDNDVHNLDKDSIIAIFELVQRNNRILTAMYPNEDINKYKSAEILSLEVKLSEKIPTLDKMLVCLAVTEAIFFSSSFAVVFWFSKNNMFPGASKANQLIKNDEGKHVENGALIHRTLIQHKLPQSEVYEMVKEAVEVESSFMEDAMPEGLRGMNSKLMIRYIKYSADWFLDMFGYEKLYNIRFEDTFDFMTKQSITDSFTDFFKGEEVNYKIHGVNETFEDKKTVFDDELDDI